MTGSQIKVLWGDLSYQYKAPTNAYYIIDGDHDEVRDIEGLVVSESDIPNPTKIGIRGISDFIRYHLKPRQDRPRYYLGHHQRLCDLLHARLENDHLIFYEGVKFLEDEKTEKIPLVFVTVDCDILLTAMQLAKLYPNRNVWICRPARGNKACYARLGAVQAKALCNKFVSDMMTGSTDYWSHPNSIENNDAYANTRCKTPKRAVSRQNTEPGEVSKPGYIVPPDLRGNDAADIDLAKQILVGEYTLPVGHQYFFWSRNLCTCFRAGKFSIILRACFESVQQHYDDKSFDRVVYAQTQPLSTLLLGVAFVYLRYVGIAFRYIPEDFIQVFENDGLGNLRIEGPDSRPGDFVVPAQAVVCAIRPNSMNIIEERLCRAYSAVTGVTVDSLDYSIMTAICQVFLPQSLLSLKDACHYIDPDTCRPLITKASSDTDVVRAIIDAKPFLHYIKPQIRGYRKEPFLTMSEYKDWSETI